MLKSMKTQVLFAIVLGVLSGSFYTGFSSDAQAGVLDRVQERRAERKEKRAERQTERKAGTTNTGDGTRVQMTVKGASREFLVYGAATGGSKPGIIIAFHGSAGDGPRMAALTQFHTKSQGYLTLYPTSSGFWNDGRKETSHMADDVAFTDAMINYAVEKYGADRNRVYATGVSNGGMMTHRLACERTTSIRAFATVVANLPVAYINKCAPSGGVPIIMFNSTSDTLMKWDGGEIPSLKLLGLGAGGIVTSTPTTYDFYARHNACSAAYSKDELPDRDTSDGTRVIKWDWNGCRSGSDVILYKIVGGAHGWLGSDEYRKGKNPGQDVDASAKIIEFFRIYGL